MSGDCPPRPHLAVDCPSEDEHEPPSPDAEIIDTGRRYSQIRLAEERP